MGKALRIQCAIASTLQLASMVVSGAGWAAPQAAGAVAWKSVEGTKIPVPPAEHPRLYLRAPHVAQLGARLNDPVLQPAVERLRSLAQRSTQFQMEWNALQYLVSKDRALGRSTVEATLALLKKTELPDRQDACRVTGRMMVTGAIVYDWLYELLSRQEKDAFIAELVRLAKTQECGYPPTGQGAITGHNSEAMLMREMVSAGIAIYDESPEMYDLAAGRFFREHLPARNWLYDGHAYHQGDSYSAYRYSADVFPLWIFDRLGAGNIYNPEQRHVPYYLVYTSRPDGQRLRAGDTYSHSAERGRPWGEGVGTILTASYYGDGYLVSQYLRQGGISDTEAIFEFLWRDPGLQPQPISALPPCRYFGPPFGWMEARTGWDENAVIAEMKINVYNFTNHQHMDAGAFQLYHKGALAADTGLYSGSSGAYGSPHCKNYYWRTIAHNCLLVYDPNEAFSTDGSWGNDGGQRLPNNRREPRTLDVLLAPENGYRTGEVLAHGIGPKPEAPEYALLKGDITAAYSKKVQQVVRSFAFLNLRNAQVPAALVVFDRVVAADPAFRKYWLLHTLEEPQLEGAGAIVDRTQHDERGRLALDVLLPERANMDLAKVGGPGKEFWVFGQNFANDVDPERLARSSMEPGAWRIELSPKAPAAEDLFLTVMQTTDRQSGGRLAVRRMDAGAMVGCAIQSPEVTWVVLFRRDGQRSAEPVRFDAPGEGTVRCLVTDLTPGQWRVQPGAGAAARTVAVTEAEGAVWAEGRGGQWALTSGQ